MMYRGKYVLFLSCHAEQIDHPKHEPFAMCFCFWNLSCVFILIQTNSGIQPLHLASWQDSGTKHRTEGHFRKKKKILNPPAIKINQNIAMEHRHGSWKNHLWTDLNGTRSFTRLERGSECQWMRSKMTWSILKQSINEPAVGLYTKWSLPALFLAWHPRHTNFHSSSLTVVLTVRFSSFFPNSHTVAPPVESCFMFIIVSLSNWCTSRQGKKPSK